MHDYRTWLVQHGIFVWDNFSYGGWYPLTSYSLLYYLPTAVVGNLPLVFAAAVASTVLFSSIAMREWGSAALWPSRVFGVLAAAPMFTGLYAYSLGFTAMLATLKLLQLHRHRLAIIPAILTVGFSPLAFAFLCLIVVSYAVVRRGISRRRIWFAAGLAVAAAVEGAALVFFSTAQGVYPFHWEDFLSVMIVSVLGVLLARRSRAAAPLVAFFALWGLGSVFFYVVASPLGDNWTRLDAFVFPVMLLTASLADFKPRRLVVLACTLRPRVQRRAVRPAHPVPARQQHAAGELLDARDPLPARAPAAGVPRRGRADRGALGGGLDTARRDPARARLVPPDRRGLQRRPLLELPRRAHVRRMAPPERGAVRRARPDGAARLGRRPAGEADRPIARRGVDARVPEQELAHLRASRRNSAPVRACPSRSSARSATR